MARPKKQKAKPKVFGGKFVLELQQRTLESWCRLQCGDAILVNGTAHKQGAHPDTVEDIQFDLVKREEEVICVDFKACSMGRIFQQKLSDIWHCFITDPQQRTTDVTDASVVGVNKPVVGDDTAGLSHTSCSNPYTGLLSMKKEAERGDYQPTELEYNCKEGKNDITDMISEGNYEEEAGLLNPMDKEASTGVVEQTSRVKHEELHSENSDAKSNDSDEDFYVEQDDNIEDREHATLMYTQDFALSFSCRFCKKSFHRSKNPKRALSSHETRVCRKNPGSASNLAPVKRTKSEQYPFECTLCTCAFKTDAGLLQHTNKMHGKQDVDDEEPDLDSLGMVNCDICDRPCLSERARRLHKTLHHGVQEPRRPVTQTKIACDHCGEVFNNKITHRQHTRYKCSKNPDAVKCSYCNICLRAFASDKLAAHKAKKHKEIIRKVCEICGAEFNSRNGLYIHKRRVHNSRPPEWHCEPCNKSFQFKFQLEKHLTKHSEERKIMCSVCGKMFKHRDQEIKHRRRVHEGRYPYHCPVCGHGMSDKGKLDTHKCGRVRRTKATSTINTQTDVIDSEGCEPDVSEMVVTELLENDGCTTEHQQILPQTLQIPADMPGVHLMSIPDYEQGVWQMSDVPYSANMYQ